MRHYESKSRGRYLWRENKPLPPGAGRCKVWRYVCDLDPKARHHMDKLRQFGDRYSESPAALRYGG